MTINDPRVQQLCDLWHEAGRKQFAKNYENLNYDSDTYRHYAKDRSKYIALDQGGGGYYLIDKATEQVYRIKAYGVINRKKFLGTVNELIAKLQAVIAIGGVRDYYNTFESVR